MVILAEAQPELQPTFQGPSERPTDFKSSQKSCRSRSLLSLPWHTQGIPPMLYFQGPFLSFALHFVQLLPLSEMHPIVSLALECPQNAFTPSQLGCGTVCCPLPQSPGSIFLVLQNPFHSPELGMNIKLITKQFLLLIENSLQGVNSRRKKGLL